MMKRHVVDCSTGQASDVEITAEEERQILAEKRPAREEEQRLEADRIKGQLLDAASHLERAKALAEEGLLTQTDVADCQTKVAALKQELKSARRGED